MQIPGLRRAGVIGGEVPAAVRVLQEGQIRTRAGGRWLRFTAEEDYTLDPPGFVWNASLLLAECTGRTGDRFVRERSWPNASEAVGLFTVVDASGR